MKPKFKEIYLFCMGRGGGNAILFWLFGQCEYPFRKRVKDAMPMYFNRDSYRDNTNRISRENMLHGKKRSCLSEFGRLAEEHPDLVRDSSRVILYSLRDPFNMMASWLTNWERIEVRQYPSSKEADKARDDYIYNLIIPEWKALANEYLGHTKILPPSSRFVNYNTWVFDEDYRRDLADFVGMKFSDKNFNFVSHHGGGSSYTQQKKLKKSELARRWESSRDDKVYRNIFESDKELRGLSKEIFDISPEL